MRQVQIMPDASEIVSYNCPDMPVLIQEDWLSNYPDRRALCHWHKDIELISVIAGEMNYHINGKPIRLHENDCVIINSQQLHYGYARRDSDCHFICIRFHPNVLSANPGIYQKYVLPLIENSSLDFFLYEKDSQNYLPVKELVDQMLVLNTEKKEACELEILSLIHRLWQILFCQFAHLLQKETPSGNQELQKKMVSYIYENYQKDLTLAKIAASANISRSKCCMIFREYLQQPPVEFLNRYRLEISRRLLLDSQSSITQIAFSCGFNHLSYFSKKFAQQYGCTPTDYRKRKRI